MKVNCTNCGKEIEKFPAQIKRSKTGNLYCSRSCSSSQNNKLFKKWKNHPQYKTGKTFYRTLKIKSVETPKCENCGFDNILALEVHHIDRNRKNNEIENLSILCANCHKIEHRTKYEDVV